MGTSTGANFHQPIPPKMLPPRQQQLGHVGSQPTLALVSPHAQGMPVGVHEFGSNSDLANDSRTESASSRETWPIETNHANGKAIKVEREGESEYADKQIVGRVSPVSKLSLREVAREGVEVIADRMVAMSDELLEELKSELRTILEGTGGPQQRDEFLHLQRLVQGRSDLDAKTLLRAHRAHLEILVCINTGIQAFLHPNISLPQSWLMEVFFYKRCRNIACQSALPADDCSCEICAARNGFCNQCMCVVCNKFDFEVNTCRWIGCDMCSHWTHTDCAIRVGKIGMGTSSKSVLGSPEMLFRCQACNRTSALLGWVRDVFQHCAPGWDKDSLARELDFISRIFRGSEDPRGRKLFSKCEDLVEKMRNGIPEATTCRMMLMFFQEIELDTFKDTEGEEAGRLNSPREACNRIADVVQEALRKMDMVAEEKMRMFKRARVALDVCDRELEDKAREVADLKLERQRQKQQVEELESIVRLKQAESEMFQFKAGEARREAERLQNIALAKSEKAEQDYASRYLKARLEEAEMEKQFLFEKLKQQESLRSPQGSNSRASDPSQTVMPSNIHDLLKNVYATPSKTEGPQPSEHHSLGSAQ